MNKDDKIKALQEEVRRLKEVERTFSAVMDHLPIGITVADAPDGRIRAMTRYERDLSEAPRKEMEGVSLEEYAAERGFFHLDGVTRAKAEDLPLFRAIHKGETVRGEEWIIETPAGKKHHILSVTPVKDEHGKVVCVIGSCEETDKLKEVQRELQRSRDLLNAVLEEMPSGVIIAEPADERILLFNRRADEILKMDFKPSTLLEMYRDDRARHPDGRPYKPEEWPLARSIDNGETVIQEELIFLRGDGSTGVILANSKPVKDEDGAIAAGVLVFQDISLRKEMEERIRRINDHLEIKIKERTSELQESEARLKSILDQSPSSIYIKDLEGRYVFINRTAREVLRISGTKVEGKTDRELIARELADQFSANDRGVIESGAPIDVEEFIPQSDGLHTVLSTKFLLRDLSGTPYAVCGISTDITYRKEVEEELRQSKEKLEQSNQALQDFASVASHDLQEPLRKVRSFSDLLTAKYGDAIDEEGKLYLQRVHSAVERMTNLIQDLLAYSRVTTKARPFKWVDLNKLLTEVLSDLEFRIEEKKAIVDAGRLPAIKADPTQLRQIFQNLIGNSLKFCKTHPVVKIYSESTGSLLKIFVEDNGVGFDEKNLDKIFRPFQRLHGRSEYEGTGMGLAIVKRIVERHKGRISARSAPGKGATFIIELPKQGQR